jgi:sulfur relay (sulfurtransferase) DsrF/TusC family protein
MSDQTNVLFANDAFYAAFMNHDIEAMSDLWAKDPTISCIHPGWNYLLGRDAVIESWNNILTNYDGPSFTIEGAKANIFKGMAVVICYEVFKMATLVATNIFVWEEGVWRIMHHQSSETPPPVLDEINQKETIQ